MTLTKRFEQALATASELHREQRRKGTNIPYVSHLLSVAGIALQHGADEDEAIAALLHDAIEDCGGAPIREQIRAAFGDRVTEIVDGCTDAEVIPKPPWQARKQVYLDHLRADSTPSIRLVSASDKLHNLSSILSDYRECGEVLWDRFNASRDQTLWYYRSLAEIFAERGPKKIAGDLTRLLDDLAAQIAAQTDESPCDA